MATARNSLTKIKSYIRDYLTVLQEDGLPIERVFLFGSYATGHHRKWSDIDVCVISPRFGKKVDPYEYLWTKGDVMMYCAASNQAAFPRGISLTRILWRGKSKPPA